MPAGKWEISHIHYFTPLSRLKLISPEGYEASKYAILGNDGYVRYDNIDFSNILASISALKAEHDYFLDYAKYEVFNMLKACGKLDDDREKRTLLLNTSSDVIDWMIKEAKDADEKLAYYPLKANVALLLKNKSAFDVFYSKMTKEEIEGFKESPFSEIMF